MMKQEPSAVIMAFHESCDSSAEAFARHIPSCLAYVLFYERHAISPVGSSGVQAYGSLARAAVNHGYEVIRCDDSVLALDRGAFGRYALFYDSHLFGVWCCLALPGCLFVAGRAWGIAPV